MKSKCTGHKIDGSACGRWPIAGSTVCPVHGGSAPQVKARAAIRAELMNWGLTDALPVDPGEILLKLVSQAAARAHNYSDELRELALEHPTMREAFIGQAQGEWGPVGDYIRGLVVLEAQERERAANWAAKAIAAGLAERQVRLAERQGALIADVLRSVMGDASLGLSEEQRRAMPDVIRRHLAAVA